MPDGYQETGQAGFDDLMARLEEKGFKHQLLEKQAFSRAGKGG
jgi:hypothetical protein